MYKFGSEADLAVLAGPTNPNTPEDRAHEETPPVPGGIWITDETHASVNDRIIYAWQSYAGKHSEKTIDRHLAAIRFLEDALAGKAFDRLTCRDVGDFRDQLKAHLAARDDRQKSKSTISHTASHVRAFLEWLIQQEGFRRLPHDLPDYVDLPKSAYAKALPKEPKAYPTIEEAAELLAAMPDRTGAQNRNRAIFALAFLGALRADTLISLRLEHIDLAGRKIVQDGTSCRTKNGKSLIIQWFALPEIFGDTLTHWLTDLIGRGFRPTDALFPDLQTLQQRGGIIAPGQRSVDVMTSTHAVTDAFAAACKTHSDRYTPHAAKHTIASERDKRPLTAEQRKAWSENMGHENEQITDTHYGKLTDHRRFEVLEAIGSEAHIPDLIQASDAEKVRLFNAFLQIIEQA
ncbi:MAG: tyrosine-type recombinase/integrase [Planktotalea arctica]